MGRSLKVRYGLTICFIKDLRMSKNIHSAEMHRLADATEGTQVWYQAKGHSRWKLINNPQWNSEYDYIVADEWAEIRKFFIDNGYIYLLDAIDGSIIKDFNPSYREDIKYYFTSKPDVVEPTYYYQYEKVLDSNNGCISISDYMTDNFAIANCFSSVDGWFKIESSKREWGH